MTAAVRVGDANDLLAAMPGESVQCCVTSPPYYGLRDYGMPGQIGLEPSLTDYVAKLVAVFADVRRVLRPDGTLWLNLGDSYANSGPTGHNGWDGNTKNSDGTPRKNRQAGDKWARQATAGGSVKPKDLLGVPWMVAFALRDQGWYLRSDLIWSKPNPMPESVTDRPTRAHEYVFLLSKSARYFYDADAIREGLKPGADHDRPRTQNGGGSPESMAGHDTSRGTWGVVMSNPAGRNKRSVWTVATQPYAEAHFATFPPNLIEPMILAGTAKNDVVLDPFSGSGTTGVVCGWHGRDFIGLELNPAYAHLARNRIAIEGRPSRRPSEPTSVGDGQTSLFDLIGDAAA